MSEDLLDSLLSASKAIGFDDKPENPSAIHTGDTDSSDDEDNPNYENSTLNECGKTIKTLLNTNDNTPSANKVQKGSNPWDKPSVNKRTVNVEPSKLIFGVRVINPLIPSNVLEERIANRDLIPFNSLKFFTQKVPSDKDWVVAGAIVQKTLKTSQNGKKYCMWILSDLKSELKSIIIFLFGTAYKELWKTTVGVVVGILNPNVLELRKGSKEEACLSVDNYQKVMVIGQSRDYGICKSMKKTGERCTAFINKAVCEVCLYHVKQEYQQFSKRSEIQSAFTKGPRNLNALRNKVLGKDQVFYGGKLYAAIKNPKLAAKDKGRLQSLNSATQQLTQKIKAASKKGSASSFELTAAQRMRDLERLKQLGVDTPLSSEKPVFNAQVSREVDIETSKNMALQLKNSQVANPKPQSTSDLMIDLNIDFKSIASAKQPKLSRNALTAKQNALKWVETNGSIKKVDPNSVKPPAPTKKRPLESLSEIPPPKVTKIQENEFFSERFKKMMAAKSSHLDLVEKHENEQEEKYFNKLEMKERLEEKMITTYKMPCKAVRCLKCKYTNFSASDLCKSERHPLKVFDAVKRFFKCGNCGNRTVCLEVVPTKACNNCGCGKWERTGMMKERKLEIGGPKLSIRGGEQKFVNSVISDSNLDLMVPDE